MSNDNTGYTGVFSYDPASFTAGMPTVDTGAAIANLSTPAQTGIAPSATVSAMPAPQVPTTTGPTGNTPAPSGSGFFSQNGPAQFALGAVQTLGSLWNSFQQHKLAKQTFKFQKEAYATNLANQEQSYNTELEDRINARYVTEGRTNVEADKAAYLDKNRL